MKKLLKKDKKKRELVYKNENYILILKSIIKNNNFSIFIRLNALKELTRLRKNSNKSRLKDRCSVSGRNKVMYKFKFSRLTLLSFIRNGFVYGSRKTS